MDKSQFPASSERKTHPDEFRGRFHTEHCVSISCLFRAEDPHYLRRLSVACYHMVSISCLFRAEDPPMPTRRSCARTTYKCLNFLPLQSGRPTICRWMGTLGGLSPRLNFLPL